MFPVNSIIDKALTSIRASVEDQVYSTLATHLKDYEGPAEDFTDRYGEFKESDIIRPHQHPVQDYGAIKYIMSLFPKRSDIWIITVGYVNNHCGSGPYYRYQTVYLIDNYGTLYEGSYNKGHSPANTTKLVVKDISELILQPRLNNTLIDLIKKKLPDIEYGSTSQGDSCNKPYNNNYLGPVASTLASICQEIAKYHNRLYGIINNLKKENAVLKTKLETPAPDYMDDLLGFKAREPI